MTELHPDVRDWGTQHPLVAELLRYTYYGPETVSLAESISARLLAEDEVAVKWEVLEWAMRAIDAAHKSRFGGISHPMMAELFAALAARSAPDDGQEVRGPVTVFGLAPDRKEPCRE